MNRRFLILFVLMVSIGAWGQEQTKNDSIKTLFENLPEILVKGERPIVKMERGAMVYDLKHLQKQMPSDNAYELIGKIPGVVMNNGEINFANHSLHIIINGVVTTVSADKLVERLKAMPAEQLAKAEVMLSAPPKYHVRGAVINIVTKELADQLSIMLKGSGEISKYGFGRGIGNLIYQHGKLTLEGYESYMYGKEYAKAEHHAIQPLSIGKTPYEDKVEHESKDLYHNYRIETTYRMAENNVLNFAYTGNWNRNDIHHLQTGSLRSEQKSLMHTKFHNLEMGYVAPFGLNVNLSFLHFQHPTAQNLSGDLKITSYSNQIINKWLLTADQTHRLNKGWEIDYGMMMQVTNHRSWQNQDHRVGQSTEKRDDGIHFIERILNGYVGANKSFGKQWNIEATLTLENYHRPTWNKWFAYPTLNVSWQANDNHSLTFTFNSNATYPSYWSTLNSVYYSSAYSEIWGNPDLKPTNIYQSSLTWIWKRKYQLTAFYDIYRNNIVQMAYQPEDRMVAIMKEINLNYSQRMGIQLNASYRLGSWLTGNAFATLIYRHDKCEKFFDLQFNRKKLSVLAGANTSFKLSKKPNINLTVNSFFQSASIEGMYDIKDLLRVNASLKYAINKHWLIDLSARNITNGGMEFHSRLANQNFSIKNNTEWRSWTLGIRYLFGNYKERKHKEVNTSRMG